MVAQGLIQNGEVYVFQDTYESQVHCFRILDDATDILLNDLGIVHDGTPV